MKAAGVLLALGVLLLPAEEPALGTYHWPVGTAGVEAFAAWLDRPSVWALDFVGSESWDNVGWPTWWLGAWSKWTAAKPGRRLVLAIPLLPGPGDGSGPTQGKVDLGKPVSLERGAAGAYNPHFKQLAENLVAHTLTDVILRPGWEFNGGWYTWKAKGKEKLFAEYWRQVVTTMRAVPGAKGVQFCWNPTLGDQDFPAEQAWPGDEFVDLVGVDVYDETWAADTYPWPKDADAQVILSRQKKVWKEWILESPRGLAYWTRFAKDHGKPLAIPEWGLNHREDGHAGRDNVHFIEQMYAFVTDPSNRVAFHGYFDVNADSDHRHQLSPGVPGSGKQEGTEYPAAAARFRELFRARK